MTAEQIIDLQRLIVADQRNHAEAGGLPGIIFLVFRLLDRRCEERGSSQGFLTIDFAVAARAGDAISDGVRAETNAAGVAQRFDAPIVGNHVAELDDFRDTTEMLDKGRGGAKGLAREIVDGDLTVIEIGIGDTREVLEDKILNDAEVLTDGGGAYLLVVAHNKDGFSQIERDESHDIALAGLVNDDDVKARDTRVEIFNDAGKRHHPDGNRAAAFGHFSGRLGTQERNTNAVAFADAANGVQPADQRLPLAGGGAVGLRGPRAFVNEADSGAAELLAKFLAFRLQSFERDAGAAVEFIVELAPDPRGGRIAWRFAAAVNSGAVADGAGPRRSCALQLSQQHAPQVQVGLAALELQKTIVSIAIIAGILVTHGSKEFGCGFRRLSKPRGELQAAFEVAVFSFELEQSQFLETRVKDREKRMGDGLADAQQFAISADDRRLLGQKLFPAK